MTDEDQGVSPRKGQDEDDHDTTVRVVKRAARARSLWGWLTAAGPGNAIVAAGGALVVAATMAWTGIDAFVAREQAMQARTVLASTAQPARSEPLGGSATLYEVTGRDKDGRIARFDFIVLSKDTVWVRGRSDQISHGGSLVSADTFKGAVIDQQVGARIASARQLVGVGVASEEGDSAAEEARAEARARQIAGWLTAAGPATVPVWSLNLGQYQGVCTGCDRSVTDWQRPIIIVGLVAADSGVSLGQALADALRDRSNLPDPSAYSKFALIRER